MADERAFLRHAVATLAYRAGKALRGASPAFASFSAGPGSRTPVQILAHMGDLLDWALSQARGQEAWQPASPLSWDAEVARFFAALERFDMYLAGEEPLARPCEHLFQGAIADALTHTGQLTMLRRLAGGPVKGENYSRADIAIGRIGPAQTAPRREFD